jgi:hypothetical protein
MREDGARVFIFCFSIQLHIQLAVINLDREQIMEF